MKNDNDQLNRLFARPWVPYVLPFALFLALTGLVQYLPSWAPQLYVTKTIVVGALLWVWRHKYSADFSTGLSLGESLTAFFCGLLSLIVWIAPEKYLFQIGQSTGFDPYALTGSTTVVFALIAVRLFGASVVVPVMEELFWRSFLMRYLINPDFRSVPIGAFSWLSFMGVAILFGLEHHRVVVGIVVGVLYNLLLIHQKNLKGAILAHAVTNFGLGIYVVATDSWTFW